MDVHPIKNVLIGIDPYPYAKLMGMGNPLTWPGKGALSVTTPAWGGWGRPKRNSIYSKYIYIYIKSEKNYIIWEDSNNVFKVTWVVTCGSATLRSWAAITFLLEKENMKRQRSWSLRPNLVQNIHGKWFSPKQNKQNCKCAPYNLVWNPCLLLYPMWIS